MKVARSLSLNEARLQRQMKRAGMESESSYDHGRRYEYYYLFCSKILNSPNVRLRCSPG